MNAIETLATFVADTPRGGHAATSVATAKRALLDTLGCMLLGADAPVTRAAVTAAAGWGAGPMPVYGTTARLPAPFAALANGAAAHAFDVDDYTLIANDHPSAVLVPALLAAVTTETSGPELIDAYLTGLEVIFRIGEAVNMGHYNLGWHATSTIDGLGATAALARLGRLDAPAAAMALSLTTSLGSGYVSQFGTMAKPLHAGIAAKASVIATGLARAGATGTTAALDGAVSFASLMVPPGEARFADTLAKLGRPWGLDEFGLGAKLYPSCAYTHRAIDGALELRARLGIQGADEVAAVEISLPDFFLAILPFGTPQDPAQALFSTAYCAAVALATGACRADDFRDAALARSDIMALCDRITVTARTPKRPWINLDGDDPDLVRVRLADGRQDEAAVAIWTGAPGRELSEDQMTTKFHENCRQGGVTADRADAIADAVAALDRAPDLGALQAALGVS